MVNHWLLKIVNYLKFELLIKDMSDRDTILFRLTKETAKEIETWRKKISEAIKIDLNKVTKKQGEIA